MVSVIKVTRVIPGMDTIEYQGLSTDIKPTPSNLAPGSTFYELNTGKGFDYDPNNINPITGNGWWEV